jgi:hypothetical protein
MDFNHKKTSQYNLQKFLTINFGTIAPKINPLALNQAIGA